jgi:iron complex transport system ATP-binding protein
MTFELRDVGLRAGRKVLLRQVDAMLWPGRVAAIVGPNGAGKTSLLALLSGQRRPDEGAVLLDGVPLAAHASGGLALRRAVMLQESHLVFDFTAREVVELGRYPHRRHAGRDERGIVAQALEAAAVRHLADRGFQTLSGGEKARVHLARVLAQVWEPPADRAARWLLLDEPTAALDLAHQHQSMRLLRAAADRQGMGVAVVLHDLNLALRYADDVLLLEPDAPARFGPAAEVLTRECIARVWGVACEEVEGPGNRRQCLFA